MAVYGACFMARWRDIDVSLHVAIACACLVAMLTVFVCAHKHPRETALCTSLAGSMFLASGASIGLSQYDLSRIDFALVPALMFIAFLWFWWMPRLRRSGSTETAE
jgi:hypothetical protein